MKQLAEYICRQISGCMENGGNKQVIRVDGFEDIRIYAYICRKLTAAMGHDWKIIAKLSRAKYFQLKNVQQNADYEFKYMLDNSFVDIDDHMTSYRNIVPSEDEKLIVLMMGTDMVDDKGGLSDFYAIDPQKIDILIGDRYERLISNNLRCVFGDDRIDTICRKFFKVLFSYVPKNLSHVSTIMDGWENDAPSLQEAIYDLFARLPEWNVPLICDAIQKLTPAAICRDAQKLPILDKACKFISGRMYQKVTRNTLSNVDKKFKEYQESEKKYSIEFPSDQAVKSYDELHKRVMEFIDGINIVENRMALFDTDFSIVDEIINFKTRKPPKPEKADIVTGNPMAAMLEAMLTAAGDIITSHEYADKIVFCFDKAQIAGIPSSINAKTDGEKQERDNMILASWQCITSFAGGVIEFINSEDWEFEEGMLAEIECEPAGFFEYSRTASLLDKGILSTCTGEQHKIEFTVQIIREDEVIVEKQFCWKIDPLSDWVMAFSGLRRLEMETNRYIPFSIWKDINLAFAVSDEESFAYLIDHSQANFDEYNVLDEINNTMQSASTEEKEATAQFYKLGEAFVNFKERVLEKGFFSVIGNIDAQLVSAYVELARRVSSDSLYCSKLRPVIKCFANAFLIAENCNPIKSDIYLKRAIVPAYHPAVIEKLSDRMLFVRTGIHQWLQERMSDKTDMKLHDRIDQLESLASVHNAVDSLMVKSNQQMPCSCTYGYCSLYSVQEENDDFISANDIMSKEAVFDDDFDEKEMKTVSREAKLITRVLDYYVDTFPRGYASLSLAFVNPGDLQIIVSALYCFISSIGKNEKLRNDVSGTDETSITLNIITPNKVQGARAYLSYWINNMFTIDEGIDIKAYIKIYSDESEIPELVPATTDVAFFYDALDTDNGASYNFYQIHSVENRMTECRYPMVFKPYVATVHSNEHAIDITQPQFEAATWHTQVLHAYARKVVNDFTVGLVQNSQTNQSRGHVIRDIQDRTVWLACMDSAMDKKTVRDLYARNTGIIGFTTGEGSFGQMNMALTCRNDVMEDIGKRCRRKLKTMFPSWTDVNLSMAAGFCMKKAVDMDGLSILRAINPDDREMNNYLAYLIADELSRKSASGTFNVLIRLDSYRHWFKDSDAEEGEGRIPDFLQLSAEIQPDSHLNFTATVIECKIAQFSNMQGHIDRAQTQVLNGIDVLSRHFDPAGSMIEHRYWMAQLYRAIVFVQTDMEFDDITFRNLTDQLNMMLDGDYEIEWRGRIMACAIDDNMYTREETLHYADMDIECWHIGQLAMQNILLNRNIDTAASYDAQAELERQTTDEDIEDNSESDICETLRTTGTLDMFDELDVFDEAISAYSELPDITPDIVPANNANMPDIRNDVTVVQNTASAEAAKKVFEPEEIMTDVAMLEQNNAAGNNADADITDIRVLIGNDKQKRRVYWEYGNRGLANRHLLITGGSGQGKTYAIQTFLYELARQGTSSVVFDYTDGFLPDKLEPPFAAELDGRIEQRIAIINGIPINPFKRQMLKVGSMSIMEKSTLAASRFAAIMKHVYSFGEQQTSALYSACREGMEHYGDAMDFNKLQSLLENADSSYAKTVLSKMQQLFDLDIFNTSDALDWTSITDHTGKVTVMQLTTLDREIQTVITEMLMWDAWYSLVKSGQKDVPFVVVLDEAQNLSFSDGSPAQKILQEGRKYGWSAWFATQFMKGALSSDEISRLQQASERLYFKPSNEEVSWVAQQLGSNAAENAQWVEMIKQMQKGECIVQGDRIRPNGVFGAMPPAIVKVSSFEDRT